MADVCEMRPVFMEDFDVASIGSRKIGPARWTAHTPWNGDFGDAAFADPGPDGPFAVKDGTLSITASKGLGGKWRSGMIAAADAFGTGEGVRYGYFEARMKLPPGPGTWPGFWLATQRPWDASGPGIELDVIEYYGLDPAAFQSAVHVWYPDPKLSRHETHKTNVPSGSLLDAFHTFGIRVAPDFLTFYLDRRSIWRFETPAELKLPMYPIVDLALGSGFPVDKTPDPSVLLVDYIHVYEPDAKMHSDGCLTLEQ